MLTDSAEVSLSTPTSPENADVQAIGQEASPERPTLRIQPSRGWAAINLREIWQFRDLLLSLAGRDLKLRYKQTALGVIWVVLQPLLAAGVFTFVFGTVAGLPSGKTPYFLFSYAGLLGWNLFATTLSKSSNCLVGNSPLISKVFFPRLVLPLSTVPSALVDFGVALGMMAGLMLIYHVAPTPQLLLLPVWMAVLLMLSLGIGLCAASLTVSYRDVQYILPVVLNILLYASPVAYSTATVMKKLAKHGQWLRTIYLLNPLCAPLEAFRWSFLGGDRPPIWPLVYAISAAVVTFVVGAYAFKRMERKFADVI